MTDANYIRARVSEMAQARGLQAQAILPPKQKSSFLPKFLGLCIGLMFLGTMFLVVGKRWSPKVIKSAPVAVAQAPDYWTKGEAQGWTTSMDERVANLEKTVKLWNYRAWLLSLAHNENANIAKDGKDYITFDHDWKMNRAPRTMTLTEEMNNALKPSIR